MFDDKCMHRVILTCLIQLGVVRESFTVEKNCLETNEEKRGIAGKRKGRKAARQREQR